MTTDESPPLPLPPKSAIHPTNDVPHQSAPDCLGKIPANEPPLTPDSLDTQETSVRESPISRFLAEKPAPIPPPQPTTWREILLQQIGTDKVDQFVHGGWAPIRKRITDSMFRTNQSDSRIRSFLTCGRGAWVESAIADPTRTRLRIPHCHDRLCMVCGNIRSHRIRDALLEQINGRPVSFITLTLCGKREGLGELLDRLFSHFRALRRHPLWDNAVVGGAAILEIKHSAKAQRWHPHLHIIADAKYIPQAELSAVWRGISRDSFIVDVRRVKNDDVVGSYVCKYASKPLDTSFTSNPKLLDEAMEALKGRRLVTTFGEWYGTRLSNAEDEELADDMVDAAGYEKLHPLWLVIDAATEGERWAIELLRATPGAEERWRQSLTWNSS